MIPDVLVPPSVSVVINTDGRAAALKATVDGLRRMKYRNFEICIVCGPTEDGTREYVASLGDMVKTTNCPERNLSRSRNLGIALASGSIVVFIDDDGVPEPEWLDELVVPFADAKVGAAGGLVYDHTGFSFQYLYAACDRLGNAIVDLTAPASDWNYPFALKFPYVQGTNGAFRRSRLVEIGGFDEEYEFYLDETDVCCRMVDAGLEIVQLANARVHHKFLPSYIRNEGRITVKKFAVIKNKIYFSLINNRGHYSNSEVIEDAIKFINIHRADLAWHIDSGRLDAAELIAFDQDVDRALAVGLARGLNGSRRTRPPEFFANPPAFRPCPTLTPATGARAIIFLSQDYPPEALNGVSRYTYDIARAVAEMGHIVHVLTKGADYNRVDLEEGVWVHRIVDKTQLPAALADGTPIPAHIWNHSATMLEETRRIDRSRQVDVVEGVSWDCETAAFVLDGSFPIATNVVTSLSNWLDSHPGQREDQAWMGAFGTPMLTLEKAIFSQSERIVAASDAILQSLSMRYEVDFAEDRLIRCPHACEDMHAFERTRPAKLAGQSTKDILPILFVGRLELRKGIDILLVAAVDLLARDERVHLWIAGDDSLPVEDGRTSRDIFLASAPGHVANRVHFLGPVDDAELRWLYANCAIFTAPSRFESFGLILVEAMTFSRPIVATHAGGMAEIIDHDVNGLLVPVEDAEALAKALAVLIDDPALRIRLGDAGRQTFERRYAKSTVARIRATALLSIARTMLPIATDMFDGAVSIIETGPGEIGWSMASNTRFVLIAPGTWLYLTFFTHDWSGLADILINGEVHETVDLYSAMPMRRTVKLATTTADTITLVRKRYRNPASNSDEVILIGVASR